MFKNYFLSSEDEKLSKELEAKKQELEFRVKYCDEALNLMYVSNNYFNQHCPRKDTKDKGCHLFVKALIQVLKLMK